MSKGKLNISYVKMVFVLAFPVMLQQFISAAANLVDNLMIGTNGKDAINGVGVSGQIFFVILLLGFGITEGVSIFIAQQFGSKKFGEMHLTFLIGLGMCLLLGVVSAIFVFVFKEPLVNIFTRVDSQHIEAYKYLRVAVFTYPIILTSIMIGSAYRSCGNTVVPMIAGIVAIGVNTSLNYLLINGNFGFPSLGVTGASIATLVARVIELILLIVIIQFKHMPFKPAFNDIFKIPMELVGRITKKSLPLIGNEFAWGLGTTAILAIYGLRGADYYTSFQISFTTANLLFVVMGGFAVAVSILIGQELGRDEMDSAKDHSTTLIKLAVITGLCVSVLAIVLSFIVPGFYNVSEEISRTSANILRVMSFFFPFYIINATLFFILRAGGDVKSVLIMDALFMWVITVPLAYFVMKYSTLAVLVVYIIVQSTEIIKLVIATSRYKKGRWLKKLV